MRWHRSSTAALFLAVLANSLTGCMPSRTAMRVDTPRPSEQSYAPGVSKSGDGLAQVDGTGPDVLIVPNRDASQRDASQRDASQIAEAGLPKTDLGKFNGSVTDTEGKDSAGMAPPVPGLFPMTALRPKMFPLGEEQVIRRVGHEVPTTRVLPPKSEDIDELPPKLSAPEPLSPATPGTLTGLEPKKIPEAPKPVTPVSPPVQPLAGQPRNLAIEPVTDLNVRKTPTAIGGMLGLGPNDSGVERAVELAKMLDVAESENRNLISRMKMLELVLENRERMLRDDETELTKASQDLIEARGEMLRLRDELAKVKKKLRQVEREDLDNLRVIIQALEKLLDSPPPGS